MRKRICSRSRGLFAVSLIVIVTMSGCGSGAGEGTFHLSGRVTFGGNAVPEGRIVFEPDTARGNSGPQGFAEIRSGAYDTRRSGRAHVGGPHIVTIDGYDGVVADEDYFPLGTSLFPTYSTTTDLPEQPHVLDFELSGSGR